LVYVIFQMYLPMKNFPDSVQTASLARTRTTIYVYDILGTIQTVVTEVTADQKFVY
jgi:hypothetical protein